jgi:Immunity protein 51
MSSPTTFPFLIAQIPPELVSEEFEDRRFTIQTVPGASVGGHSYTDLFQAFGFSGNGASWSEHIQAIVEEEAPDLFDHIEFDTEGNTFLAFADSQEAADRFTALLCPLFSDFDKLRRHFSLLDSEDFFE